LKFFAQKHQGEHNLAKKTPALAVISKHFRPETPANTRVSAPTHPAYQTSHAVYL
jgi:hypothetical protein